MVSEWSDNDWVMAILKVVMIDEYMNKQSSGLLHAEVDTPHGGIRGAAISLTIYRAQVGSIKICNRFCFSLSVYQRELRVS